VQVPDNVLSFIKNCGVKLQAHELENEDKYPCYLIYNNIVRHIVMDNKVYKTKSQLISNVNSIVSEFRTDLYDFLKKRHSQVELFEGVAIIAALDELKALPCTNIESDLELITTLASILLLAIEHNVNNPTSPMLVLVVLLYICIVAINQIYAVESQPPIMEGVTVIFYESKSKVQK
jgi:hypothetical protein